MKTEEIKVEPLGMIKNPRIVMMPDGPDHKNWIELGEKEPIQGAEGKVGYKCYIISYAPTFGHLWRQGHIDDENVAKAEKGEKFLWYPGLFVGHGT